MFIQAALPGAAFLCRLLDGRTARPFAAAARPKASSTLTKAVCQVEPGLLTGWIASVYRYPGRLHHRTPAWVATGATYPIRISSSLAEDEPLPALDLASPLLASARLYQEQARWHCRLLLLMPDHLHALLAFPSSLSMGTIISSWKGYQAKRLGLSWQAISSTTASAIGKHFRKPKVTSDRTRCAVDCARTLKRGLG